MNKLKTRTDNVRTTKDSRLEIRVSNSLKSVIEQFCRENHIDKTYFITTLILSFFKKRGKKIYKIKKTWENIEDMPTNPEII